MQEVARFGYDEADTFEAELSHLLVHQMGAFNSPVWFNCGLAARYGISYPTVRGRLDDIVRSLGFTPAKPEVTRGMKEELLAKLESGEINADEFVRKLDETSA